MGGVSTSTILNFNDELITDWSEYGLETYTFYVSFDVHVSIDTISGVETGDEFADVIEAAISDDQFEDELKTNLGINFVEVDTDHIYIYVVSRTPSSVPTSLPTILPTSSPSETPTA